LGSKTWFFDRTNKLFEMKKSSCAEYNKLDIIVCSEWLKNEVSKSIYKGHPIHMIYNWVDTNKFKPIYDSTIDKRYGLDPLKKKIVSVSAFWSDSTTRLDDAIRLASILPSEYQLVIIGKLTSRRSLPSNIIHIDFVNGTEDLSKLYTCATAYVNFSVEDTFGKVMAEAQLCGTPAIVFNATACPEVTCDKRFVVPPHDVEAMVERIETVAAEGKEKYSAQCVDFVKKNFDYKTNVGKYLKVYQEVLDRRP
jgi:glycosyltransferase involved in cell wall biosynthesis